MDKQTRGKLNYEIVKRDNTIRELQETLDTKDESIKTLASFLTVNLASFIILLIFTLVIL
ncbi:hypothetical protein [Virgibacillus sp. Bac332]|uniref:hypothetical protein n=1 Tax=Virgibacillus sp. Bac332 TaxID=2419842 RepID=UPI000EF4F6DD|nr:hypothetical protein [Virgibacillus sp. Bac332]